MKNIKLLLLIFCFFTCSGSYNNNIVISNRDISISGNKSKIIAFVKKHDYLVCYIYTNPNEIFIRTIEKETSNCLSVNEYLKISSELKIPVATADMVHECSGNLNTGIGLTINLNEDWVIDSVYNAQ